MQVIKTLFSNITETRNKNIIKKYVKLYPETPVTFHNVTMDASYWGYDSKSNDYFIDTVNMIDFIKIDIICRKVLGNNYDSN